MSTKKGFWRWALASAAVAILAAPASAGLIADPPGVTTNTSAAIVVVPKVVVDTSNGQFDGDIWRDTHIQLTNTSNTLVKAHCFYVNANGHCSNNPTVVCNQETARDVCGTSGGLCIDGWREQDFHLTLTKRQPVSWNASSGESQLPIPQIDPGNPTEQTNQDSNVIPVPEVPFVGELRCIQVDVNSGQPIASNDLKAEATIVESVGSAVDVSKYDAIGIPAIDGAQQGDPYVLNIGGPDAEYNGCPNILTLNHFFEGADLDPSGGTDTVTSRLTVVPCAADYRNQELNPATATLQFLIYNEFEQRFSTSTRVTCYREVQLADIDTRPGDNGDNMFSIFSVNTQGTLSGQTRIRAVRGPDEDPYDANGVLAIIEESHSNGSTYRAAANIQYTGARTQGDLLIMPQSLLANP